MINIARPDYTNTPASSARAVVHFQPADPAAAPVVSIVTPFFNANEWFYETARSVFGQTLQQWEWLIINDGSQDAASLAILAEFRQKDPRIRVVDHVANQGLSAARNTGFREARAEFVFQLDADDLIEPTTLEKMAWHLQTQPEFGFVTGFTVGFGSKEYLWQNGFHSGKKFLEENLVTATCLVRKSVHQAVGGYEAANRGGLEDWDFWIKSAAHGHWGNTIPEFLDWYRRRDTGREHWDNVVQSDKTEKFRAGLQKKYPALWKESFPQIDVRRSQFSPSVSAEVPFANSIKKERPRLLLIVPHFDLGGADKFNLDLIRQLQRERGYEITVVSTRRSKNPWMHEFESLTPDVFALNNFLHPSDFPLFLRYLIASRQPDAVCVANSFLGYQLLPYLRAYFPETPFLDYLHMEEEGWMDGGYPRQSVHSQSQLARTVVSSEHLKNWMVTRGGKSDAIEVAYTNIDPEIWRRDRFDKAAFAAKWNIDTTRSVLLYAGRICEQKQPRVFAEVIRQVAKKNSSFTVLVAGDGPDLPWLKEFAQHERLKQIRFLGTVPNGEMGGLLALSDIFFLPSQWEGISLALYEAMAMSVVPVAARVGGQAELVTADCGILVTRRAGEVADYTNALTRLLSSPDLRKQMAQAARQRIVDHFPIARLGTQMDAAIQMAKLAVPAMDPQSILPKPVVGLHVADILEQTRATDYADMLHREREEMVPFVKSSVLWQSCLRAGQALVEAKQSKAARIQFDEGVQAAVASRQPGVELAARVAIGNALVAFDVSKAEQIFRGALDLAERTGDNALARQLAQTLKSLPRQSAGSRPPLVSVVIPCYKQAHFLPDAVESVVAQTFSDWEILIVNDGSPDDTSEAAKKLIAKFPGKRIRLVEKTNGGLSSARNAGISAGQGKYILPLDADDKIKPALLARLVPILDSNPKVGFAYTHIQHFGAMDNEFALPDFDRVTLVTKDNIACVCSLLRKSVWEQVGGYSEAMREGYEDWDFWIGCVEHGWDGFCLHEPLFLYRKNGASMLSAANQKRERLIAQIVSNHPKLYDEATRRQADELLERHRAQVASRAENVPTATTPVPALSFNPGAPRLRVTYLIGSILGVTGGNQTLLRQAEEMQRRGHQVTILTHTPKPDWFQFAVQVIQVPPGKTMASCVPASDVVVATYFTNAHELPAIKAPVKIYYAQGDQLVFADTTMADTPENRQLRELSRTSYLLPGVRFVPNSNNLAKAVKTFCGRTHDALLPVCTDQTIFRPLQRSVPGSRFRLLIVGPDARGTAAEPLLFKGIQDIHDALVLLAKRYPHFTAVRMSSTPPDIFARFPCEFYIAPSDEMKTVLFGTAHIHIYASHYDSCPRPPQEAMAAGCAVVCTETPGAMEYCRHDENSLLVPIQSPEAIANAVERLIQDHALRDRLVQGGLQTAKDLPREREWNEWEEILLRFARETNIQNPTGQPRGTGSPERAGEKAKPVSLVLPECAKVGNLASARESLKKKQYRAAWEMTTAAIQLRPFHPEGFLLLGEIALASGDSVAARRCAHHAGELAPSWKPAKQFLKGNLRGNAKNPWLVLPEFIANQNSAATPRLTICLITKNEEKFLDQCLASVRDIAWQIVIVDTGSTDRTVEIARQHGAEVHLSTWNDDFSAARNLALCHASGDWVLVLDADEELLPEHRATIAEEMKAATVMAYRLPIIDKDREKDGCSYVPRLFRNAPGLFFVGRVHEQIFSSIEVRRAEWGLDNQLGRSALLHHGYVPEIVISRDKIARNLRLLERAIEELPGEPNLVMSLGLELVRSGKLEAGSGKYWEAFHLLASLPKEQVVPELRETLITQLGTHLLAARKFVDITQLFQMPFVNSGEITASQHFTCGLAWMELNQPDKAATQMRACLGKRRQIALSPINPEILKAGPNHCLARCLAAMKQNADAAKAFTAALEDDPQSRSARFDFAGFHFERGDALEGLKLLNELVAERPDDLRVWQLGGEIALSHPDFCDFARDWSGEALKSFPENAAIIAQCAEALLLNQDMEKSLELWKRIPSPSVRQQAALILCEFLSDSATSPSTIANEELVSAEFLKWYRRLIDYNASSAVFDLNRRIAELKSILPTFGGFLAAAVEEAGQPLAAR